MFEKTHDFLPLYEGTIPAGFPSPADDYLQTSLDLHELLIRHPAATFFVRVQGDSMQGAGIYSGDLLIVDRALNATSGSIIVALYQGEFTVKRLKIEKEGLYLVSENPCYAPLKVISESDFQVWGVVTYVIHRTR